MEIEALIAEEIKLINRMLEAHGIAARTKRKLTLCVKSSFIAYGLQIAQGESVRRVEAISRELSNELTRKRVRLIHGYTGKAVARVRDYPLAIEVPHPNPVPLSWQSASLRMGSFVALIGRSYSYTGVREEYLDLERHPHTLVAAMSGAGKSTLMRMGLLTLALNTKPSDLRIILVDLKNDDLTPFRSLPHVQIYAGDIDSAITAITKVYEVKKTRIATQEKPYRLLLVIDELAELGADRDCLRQLGSILSTGRSLGINCWAGTQYPSAQAIGSIVAASFTTRLVGMVDGKNSALVATKRAGSGAELLQTPGDFLRVDGAEIQRMKAYNISQDETALLISHVTRRFGDYKAIQLPAIASYEKENFDSTTSGSESEAVASYDSHFPLGVGRELTETEAQTVRRMASAGEFDHRGSFSMNRAMMAVYGSRSPERANWIREALERVSV